MTSRIPRLCVAAALFLAACNERPPGALAILPGEGSGAPGPSATYDFGGVKMGSSITREITVLNVGAGPLTLVALEHQDGDPVDIGAAAPTATWAASFLPGTVVPAGESVTFPATFRPKVVDAPSFQHATRLRLLAEDAVADSATATISLVGVGLSALCEAPAPLDFGVLSIEDSIQMELRLVNPTTLPARMNLGEITSTSTDHFAFSFLPGTGREFDVPPGGSVDVPIVFRPREEKSYVASVMVQRGEHCEARAAVLTGSAVESTLSWFPAQVDFQYASPGLVLTREVTFRNSGRAPITLTGFKTQNAMEFGVGTSPSQPVESLVVPPSDLAVLPVWARASLVGPRQTSLQFLTGIARQPSGTVVLKTFGGGPDVQLTPWESMQFGKVAYFPNAAPPVWQRRRLSVRNAGTQVPWLGDASNLFIEGITIAPKNAATSANEFKAIIPPTYVPAIGLKPLETVEVAIVFTPSSLGLKEAELTLRTNDDDEPERRITLSATATSLPPCYYSVTPNALSFGLVSPPEYRDQSFVIRNHGTQPGEVCLLSALGLATGADPAFTLESGAIDSQEIPAGGSVEVRVRARPSGATPSSIKTANGGVEFFLSSPTKPEARVTLAMETGPDCLLIAPDEWSFGSVQLGCRSTQTQFRIYNRCASAVSLNGLKLANAPSTDVHCVSTPGCAFSLTGAPVIPLNGLSLMPWGAPVTFLVAHSPQSAAAAKDAVLVSATYSGQNVTYRLPLEGTGGSTSVRTDSFPRPLNGADVLVVVGDSATTAAKQAQLGSGFSSFTGYASTNPIGYRLGVTSTSVGTGAGVLVSGTGHQDKVLTPTTVDVENKFKLKVAVGSNGVVERAFQAALAAFTPPAVNGANAGFLRDDTDVGVFVFSGLGEQSPWPVAQYLDAFWNIRGHNARHRFSLSAIGPLTTPCAWDTGRFTQAADLSGGRAENFCVTNLAPGLANVGAVTFGERSNFFLNDLPSNPTQIDVKLNGVTLPPIGTGGNTWQYDAISNRVVLFPGFIPAPGDTLAISYPVTCH